MKSEQLLRQVGTIILLYNLLLDIDRTCAHLRHKRIVLLLCDSMGVAGGPGAQVPIPTREEQCPPALAQPMVNTNSAPSEVLATPMCVSAVLGLLKVVE